MRIAVWHNLPSGGGKRALYNHVRGLLERGHEVESWCPSSASQDYLPLSGLIKEHVLPINIPKAISSKGLGAIWHSPAVRDTISRHMLDHSRDAALQIGAGGFDVLFANSCLFFRVPSISRFSRLPSVLYLQEPNRWLYEALPELPWIAPDVGRYKRHFVLHPLKGIMDYARLFGLRVRAREELNSVKLFDKVLANSMFSRESMLRCYGIDASVCYLGIDASIFEPKNMERRNMIVGVGSFDYIKNIDFVIRAVAHVSDLAPELIWVGNSGDHAYMQHLEVLADNLGVNYVPRLNVSDEELVLLLNQARLMAYAPRLEPFGMTPLEANLCELPVVAVAEGGVRETVVDGENGLLCESDPKSMSQKIRQLLEDCPSAEQMGVKARQYVANKWNLSDACNRLEKALIGVLDARR